ncbi:hypothetical protein VPHD51_0202 [Vibrio phage D51]
MPFYRTPCVQDHFLPHSVLDRARPAMRIIRIRGLRVGWHGFCINLWEALGRLGGCYSKGIAEKPLTASYSAF